MSDYHPIDLTPYLEEAQEIIHSHEEGVGPNFMSLTNANQPNMIGFKPDIRMQKRPPGWDWQNDPAVIQAWDEMMKKEGSCEIYLYENYRLLRMSNGEYKIYDGYSQVHLAIVTPPQKPNILKRLFNRT